ncbi:MAG TPA: flagellin [Acidimicrobiales bacterium]|jgi:flagellar hook-associated protein 3 FlgL|nr:flagellin [Acidimicrobiales bacterium]
MDISDVAFTQTLMDQLSSQSNGIAQLQEQIASGKALNQPSDNPAAVTQVLALSSQVSQLASWQTNSDTATSWLATANSTANSMLESLQSAQSLLLQAANEGAQDSTTFQALGSQINGIVSNLMSLANTQFGGRAIFAGTSASSTAYDATGNYLGNADSPTVVIGPGQGAGQTVATSVPGTALFGTGAANVFSTLSTVATALLSGTPSSTVISNAMTALGSNIATAQQASAVLGNSSEEVSNVTATLTNQITSVQASQANLEDVNVATATTQLESETTNYQAALWAAAQSLPDTLVKFLVP